jgi:hypothetical protein
MRYIYATRMKIIAQDPAQTSQRVKVGMIGLAAVLLLIGLAAAIFSTASKERPLIVVGGAHPDVVANMAAGNQALPIEGATSEPLAELGVAPSTSTDVNAAQASNIARQQ